MRLTELGKTFLPRARAVLRELEAARGDVTLGGTAGASAATVTGSGTTYSIAVSGMSQNGTVGVALVA